MQKLLSKKSSRSFLHDADVMSFVVRILSAKGNSARLACVRHAASVRPEPGSNSQIIFENLISSLNKSIYTSHYCVRLPFSGAHLSHKLRSSKLVFLVLLASIVLYTADFFLVFVSKNQVVKFASYSILKSFYDFGIFRVPLHVYHCLLFKVHFLLLPSYETAYI